MNRLIWKIHFKFFYSNRMEFFKELFLFLKTRKKFWLMPLIIILLLLAFIIVLTSVPALAPFIYTLF
jgi:hypothetical protein